MLVTIIEFIVIESIFVIIKSKVTYSNQSLIYV